MRHQLLPVLVRDDRIFVAMAAPTEKKVIDEIEFVTGKRVFPYIALAGPLDARDRRGVRDEGARRDVLRRAAVPARGAAQGGPRAPPTRAAPRHDAPHAVPSAARPTADAGAVGNGPHADPPASAASGRRSSSTTRCTAWPSAT